MAATGLLRTLPHWSIPPVPSDFTGSIADNRHYIGTHAVLYCESNPTVILSDLYP